MSVIELINPEIEIKPSPVVPAKGKMKDFSGVIKKAWEGYDASKTIKSIEDISAMYTVLLSTTMILSLPSYPPLASLSILKRITASSIAYPIICFTRSRISWLNHYLKTTGFIFIAINMPVPMFGWYFIIQPVF
jgi:hypothetical protein